METIHFHLMDHTYSKPVRNINAILNDDCFHLIFSYLSLPQRVTARVVCSRWNSVLLEMFKTQKSLKLFASLAGVRSYCDMLKKKNLTGASDFQLKSLTYGEADDDLIVHIPTGHQNQLDFVEFLLTLFPRNIRKFMICYHGADDGFCSINLASILVQWPHLTCLAIVGFPQNSLALEREMWYVVQSKLSHLTRLHLLEAENFDIIPLDILSRMERLTVQHYDGFSPLQGGVHTTHLRLGDIYFTAISLYDMLKLKPALTQTLTHLTMGPPLFGWTGRKSRSAPDNYSIVFQTMCANFAEITHFDFAAPNIPLASIFLSLSKLSRLSSLRISIPMTALKMTPHQMINLKPLSSVCHLHLYITGKCCSNSMQPSFCRWLDAFFPSLSSLSMLCEDNRNVEKFSDFFNQLINSTVFKQPLSRLILTSDDETLVNRSRFMGRHYQQYLDNCMG